MNEQAEILEQIPAFGDSRIVIPRDQADSPHTIRASLALPVMPHDRVAPLE